MSLSFAQYSNRKTQKPSKNRLITKVLNSGPVLDLLRMIELYNDDAGELERRLLGFLRKKAVPAGSDVNKTRGSHKYNWGKGRYQRCDYDLYWHYSTRIEFYRNRNSLGLTTIKLKIYGDREGELVHILKNMFTEFKERAS